MEKIFIELITNGTKSVIETLTATTITAGTPARGHGNLAFGQISGMIGLSGDNAAGTLTISFESAAILGIFSSMFGESLKEINKEVIDAVGEITNMVCGDIKRRLDEIGVHVGMATPHVISGSDAKIHSRSTREMMVIPFETKSGKFVVECDLAKT